MKLRNKKTGETGYLELEKGDDEKYIGLRVYKNDFMYKRYNSIAELNADWEDYKPAEPLIKDEKIRKAVRTWANINGAPELKYDVEENSLEDVFGNIVSFNRVLDLKDGCSYTITELCGEDEG